MAGRDAWCSICKKSDGQFLPRTEICVDCALQIAGKLAENDNVPAEHIAAVMFRDKSTAEQVAHMINHERARRRAAATAAGPPFSVLSDQHSWDGLDYPETH